MKRNDSTSNSNIGISTINSDDSNPYYSDYKSGSSTSDYNFSITYYNASDYNTSNRDSDVTDFGSARTYSIASRLGGRSSFNSSRDSGFCLMRDTRNLMRDSLLIMYKMISAGNFSEIEPILLTRKHLINLEFDFTGNQCFRTLLEVTILRFANSLPHLSQSLSPLSKTYSTYLVSLLNIVVLLLQLGSDMENLFKTDSPCRSFILRQNFLPWQREKKSLHMQFKQYILFELLLRNNYRQAKQVPASIDLSAMSLYLAKRSKIDAYLHRPSMVISKHTMKVVADKLKTPGKINLFKSILNDSPEVGGDISSKKSKNKKRPTHNKQETFEDRFNEYRRGILEKKFSDRTLRFFRYMGAGNKKLMLGVDEPQASPEQSNVI